MEVSEVNLHSANAWDARSQAQAFFARTLIRVGRTQEAIDIYVDLVSRYPQDGVSWRQLCWLQCHLLHFNDALVAVNHLELLGEDTAQELSRVALGLMHQGDWHCRDELFLRLTERFQSGKPCIVNPFVQFGSCDDPAKHLAMARCISSAVSHHIAGVGEQLGKRRIAVTSMSRRQLRVGYLCSDFNNHPTSLLLAGVIESHDRGLFEVVAYDHSRDDGSKLRERVLHAFDKVVPLVKLGPEDCANRILKDRIDILIDLNGYTSGNRNEVLALRPAPVQVNFLGYVGTQASKWIDYVIADRHVLPFYEQKNWTERIVHMPDCYYPNDRSRPSLEDKSVVVDPLEHLSKDQFVFVCFSSSYKISPFIFNAWMQILKHVPLSVLWLLESNSFVADNMKAHATRAGIDPSRIILAKQEPFKNHIQRYTRADLFLDTFPYGAHTTGADALWAGLPIVTLRGRSFASRVSSSLNIAMSLPELVCETEDEYVETAIRLARSKERLTAIKHNLRKLRMTSPLFDAAKFAVGLEKAYLQMASFSQSGKPPTSFSV